MDQTVGALRKLFHLLYQEQQRNWYPQRRGRKASARAREVWERLVNLGWTPIGEREFEYWFPVSADELHIDFSQRKLVLYLPPLEKNAEFVPVLSLKCNLDETRINIELRVMLVCRVEDDEGKEMLCGVGFRLESPYGEEEDKDKEEGEENEDEKEGLHDFYHAQLMRSLGWKSSVECPSWLPCTQPSFPLTADCPITLVLCLLLTLYGKDYCWDFYAHNHQLSDLHQYMTKLQPWINS